MPVAAANIEAIKTAPAATSLMYLIRTSYSFEYKSRIFSMAELINSKEITNAIQSETANHSTLEIEK